MNFRENQTRSKSEIKKSFLTFFKTKDVKHLASQKLKEIKQYPGELVHEYDKRFKYLLSQIPYTIEEKLLNQWFIARLFHKIREPLRMHENITYEEDLKKTQWIEFDNDWSTPLVDWRLEEKIEMMEKTIRYFSLRNVYLLCTICMMKGDIKDTCHHREDRKQEVQLIQT